MFAWLSYWFLHSGADSVLSSARDAFRRIFMSFSCCDCISHTHQSARYHSHKYMYMYTRTWKVMVSGVSSIVTVLRTAPVFRAEFASARG